MRLVLASVTNQIISVTDSLAQRSNLLIMCVYIFFHYSFLVFTFFFLKHLFPAVQRRPASAMNPNHCHYITYRVMRSSATT